MSESVMFEEVYEVLQFLGNNYINRIPEELYKNIENNRNKENEALIDFSKHDFEERLSKEAIEFIAFLNLEYWANEDEKKELMRIYDENERKLEEESREKYNAEDIFKNKKTRFDESKLIKLDKNKWYRKVFDWIKRFINK